MACKKEKWRVKIALLALPAALPLISGLGGNPRLRAQAALPPPPQFVSAPNILPAASTIPAALADVNGDGKLDLIASESTGINVYLGNGDGTFQSTPIVTSVPGCGGAPGFAIGSIQGAGYPLGIVVSDTCNNADVLFGNGDGTFTLKASYALPYSGAGMSEPIYLADMNGDGLQDILVIVPFNSITPMAVLFNTPGSPGTFGTAQTINLSSVITSPNQFNGQFAIGNFVAGGAPGLALGVTQYGQPLLNSILILQNNLTSSVTSGTNNDITSYFSPQSPITLTSASNTNAERMSGLVAADFGNGNIDLVAAEPESGLATGNLYFVEGEGAGGFSAPQLIPNEPVPYTGGLIVADLNGDGRPDLAVVNGNDGFTVLLNQGVTSGAISFQTGNGYVANDYSETPIAGAVTSNGVTDLIVPTQEGLHEFLGNGDGTFKGAPSFNAGNNPQNLIEMWNLNGQDETDLAMIDQIDNVVNLLTVPATGANGTLGPPNPYQYSPATAGETPTAIAGGCLKATDALPSCASFLAIAAVDTTSTDTNFGDSDLEFEMSAGQSSNVTHFSLPADTDVLAMAVGDFNGDGNNDVAVGLSTGEVEIFTGDGTGNFSSSPAKTPPGRLTPSSLLWPILTPTASQTSPCSTVEPRRAPALWNCSSTRHRPAP